MVLQIQLNYTVLRDSRVLYIIVSSSIVYDKGSPMSHVCWS